MISESETNLKETSLKSDSELSVSSESDVFQDPPSSLDDSDFFDITHPVNIINPASIQHFLTCNSPLKSPISELQSIVNSGSTSSSSAAGTRFEVSDYDGDCSGVSSDDRSLVCSPADPARDSLVCSPTDPARDSLVCSPTDPARDSLVCSPTDPTRDSDRSSTECGSGDLAGSRHDIATLEHPLVRTFHSDSTLQTSYSSVGGSPEVEDQDDNPSILAEGRNIRPEYFGRRQPTVEGHGLRRPPVGGSVRVLNSWDDGTCGARSGNDPRRHRRSQRHHRKIRTSSVSRALQLAR